MQADIYILPGNPATPPLSLSRLRSRARRAGYRIARDLYANTYSLVDPRLRTPLIGLHHVELPKIARAVEMARAHI